jgi:hypothetical protein
MRNRGVIVIFAGALLVALVAVVSLAGRPAMPASWGKLRPGMTQPEAEWLSGLNSETISMGCWQRVECPAPMLGADSRWRLGLDYDQPANSGSARLVGATARFVHPFGLLNGKPRRLVWSTPPTNQMQRTRR